MSLNMFLLMLCLKTEQVMLGKDSPSVWELREVDLNLCSTFAQ